MRWLAALSAIIAASTSPALAYTAAGDRTFPATVILPEVAPTDDVYVSAWTLPLVNGTNPADNDRLSNTTLYYDKTITERLSVGVKDSWNRFDMCCGTGTQDGWMNLQTSVTYMAILDPADEFLLSVGVNREWGGTGASSIGSTIGALTVGATTPQILLGWGMGRLSAPYLRPFAINATAGYQLADNNTRADQLPLGLAIEYSIPYLESKVASVPLPDFVRRLTPIVELSFTTPPSATRGNTTAGLVAPGFTYSGEGYEVAVEALVPTTRFEGSGVGVIAQFHLSLDYFFPETLGRPLFSRY